MSEVLVDSEGSWPWPVTGGPVNFAASADDDEKVLGEGDIGGRDVATCKST
jgi:hypothetical protein